MYARIKTIGILFFITTLLSCNSNEESLSKEVVSLQKQNDSLVKIMNEINDKYVFDSIAFREIPNLKNTNDLNSIYELELLVVGYSSKNNYFVKYDTIVNGKMISPDTLKESNGGFKLKLNLNKKENPIWIDMNVENKYGKSKKGTLYDVIRAGQEKTN